MLLNDMHEDWDNADSDVREGIVTLHTNGSGYWSERAAAVRVTELCLGYVSEDAEFGELCVHFNTDDWRVDKHGLIYTDGQFRAELQAYLTSIGLDGSDVEYSEQGMQGDNYVSCDVGESFIASYKEKFADAYNAAYANCNS
jgi:N-dimethylarginine dimethylaminohydrolase